MRLLTDEELKQVSGGITNNADGSVGEVGNASGTAVAGGAEYFGHIYGGHIGGGNGGNLII
jgi:bacteriocin-like protein